jgi:transcriptional regulator with GAF, ATPase, and Fis domain
MAAETRINIEIFKTVTKAIAESDNLDIMANHLAHLLVATLDIKESKELEILASFGLSPKYLSKGPIQADKSFAMNLEGKPVAVADVSEKENLQYPAEAKIEGIGAIVSIPILFLHEVIGVLRLYHPDIWRISEQDLDSLILLAENIGLAMSYTRLHNAMQSITEVVVRALPMGELGPR